MKRAVRVTLRQRPLHAHLVSWGVLALVTLAYTWPLTANLLTSIPGTPAFADVTEFVWSAGWVRQALTRGGSLFWTDALFVPFGADLRLNAFGLLQGLLAFPLTLWLGVVGAYNVVLIGTLFLDGVAVYALIHYQVRHPLAALIAAVWFTLGIPLLAQVGAGRSALGAAWIVCGALLVLGRLLDRPSLQRGVALGLLLLAALLTDFQIVFFTGIWLLWYGADRLRHDRRAVLSRPAPVALGLAGSIVALPFLLLYYPVLAGAQAAGYPTPSLTAMSFYSFSYRHYATPSLIPVVYGGYELWAATIAAILIFRRRGAYRGWLGGALVFLLLALGPYLQPTRVPLPFALLSVWPPLAQFRTPARLVMPASIGFAVVAGFALAFLLSRIRTPRVVGLIAAAAIGGRLLLARVHDPLVVQTYPQYETYRRIADEPGDFTLLEVPFGVRSGLQRIGQGGEVVQYYQHVHGKRLINGSMARLPASIFDFYRAHPSLLLLSGEPVSADEATVQADFGEVLRWSNARYVLVHGSLLTAEQAARIESFLDRQPDLKRAWMEGDLIVYRLNRPRAAPE